MPKSETFGSPQPSEEAEWHMLKHSLFDCMSFDEPDGRARRDAHQVPETLMTAC